MTVINDFDTLKQADAVFRVSGGGGASGDSCVWRLAHAAHAGRETNRTWFENKRGGIKLEKLASSKVVSLDKTRMVKDKQSTVGGKVQKPCREDL